MIIIMKIVLTGCAGFIGSHLLEEFLRRGDEVVGIDNFSTGCQKNLDDVRLSVGPGRWKNLVFLPVDITKEKSIKSVLCDINQASSPVDVVCHQAALGSVTRSIQNPETSFSVNVVGFQNILEGMRLSKIKKLVFASSSSVYGDDSSSIKIEPITGDPISPYAATKAMNESMAHAYAKAFGFNFIGLRYFNVFGSRQSHRGPYSAVVPRWIDAVTTGKEMIVHGDGEQRRDFTYIRNVVHANDLAIDAVMKKKVSSVLNIGSGKSTGLLDLAKSIVVLSGGEFHEEELTHIDERKGDVKNSCASIIAAKHLIGYEPKFDTIDGLADMIRRQHLN